MSSAEQLEVLRRIAERGLSLATGGGKLPECGDMCEQCGDCLHCYWEDPCAYGGSHFDRIDVPASDLTDIFQHLLNEIEVTRKSLCPEPALTNFIPCHCFNEETRRLCMDKNWCSGPIVAASVGRVSPICATAGCVGHGSFWSGELQGWLCAYCHYHGAFPSTFPQGPSNAD